MRGTLAFNLHFELVSHNVSITICQETPKLSVTCLPPAKWVEYLLVILAHIASNSVTHSVVTAFFFYNGKSPANV